VDGFVKSRAGLNINFYLNLIHFRERFRVQGSGVQGARFRGSGFKVQGSRFRGSAPPLA
jgi:hypothetical protein